MKSTQENLPVVNLIKTYLKSIMLESPEPTKFFKLKSVKMQIDINLNTKINALDTNNYEISIQTHIRSSYEGATAYILNINQIGLFSIQNDDKSEDSTVTKKKLLAATCPTILLPYLRESVANITQKSGFDPLLINPVNLKIEIPVAGTSGNNTEEKISIH